MSNECRRIKTLISVLNNFRREKMSVVSCRENGEPMHRRTHGVGATLRQVCRAFLFLSFKATEALRSEIGLIWYFSFIISHPEYSLFGLLLSQFM